MRSKRCPRFEKEYNRMPKQIQKKIDKALRLFDAEPRLHSLRFKQAGLNQNRRSIRAGHKYRILGILHGSPESGTIVWYWVGRHGGPYERELQKR